jgi:hypothetical protein
LFFEAGNLRIHSEPVLRFSTKLLSRGKEKSMLLVYDPL